jgi:hypothetical protein
MSGRPWYEAIKEGRERDGVWQDSGKWKYEAEGVKGGRGALSGSIIGENYSRSKLRSIQRQLIAINEPLISSDCSTADSRRFT